MDSIERSFVSRPSPTAGRNGVGFMPILGIHGFAAGSRLRTAITATHDDVDFAEHDMGECARDPVADLVAGWLETRC